MSVSGVTTAPSDMPTSTKIARTSGTGSPSAGRQRGDATARIEPDRLARRECRSGRAPSRRRRRSPAFRRSAEDGNEAAAGWSGGHGVIFFRRAGARSLLNAINAPRRRLSSNANPAYLTCVQAPRRPARGGPGDRASDRPAASAINLLKASLNRGLAPEGTRRCCKAGSLSPWRSAISGCCSWSRATATARARLGRDGRARLLDLSAVAGDLLHVVDVLRLGRPRLAHRLRLPHHLYRPGADDRPVRAAASCASCGSPRRRTSPRSPTSSPRATARARPSPPPSR